MMKPSASIAIVILASLAAASAESWDVDERGACIKESAAYLSSGKIEEPMLKLVELSRRFYSDATELIEIVAPVSEFERSLLELGKQTGCDELDWHVSNIYERVPCFAELGLEDYLSHIARANPAAKRVLEAHFACKYAEGM